MIESEDIDFVSHIKKITKSTNGTDALKIVNNKGKAAFTYWYKALSQNNVVCRKSVYIYLKSVKSVESLTLESINEAINSTDYAGRGDFGERSEIHPKETKG